MKEETRSHIINHPASKYKILTSFFTHRFSNQVLTTANESDESLFTPLAFVYEAGVSETIGVFFFFFHSH